MNIPILVHVLRLDDLLRAVLFEERKQLVQLGHVVCSGSCCKGAVHQRMADVSLEQPFRHIDHSGTRIADKVDGAFRGCPHRFAARRQPEVLRALLIGGRVFLPDGDIQPDLCAADQSVRASGWDQNPSRACSKAYCPSAVLCHIKAGDSLQCAPLLQKPRRQTLAEIRRRGAFEAEPFDLVVRQSTHLTQMRTVLRRQRQHGKCLVNCLPGCSGRLRDFLRLPVQVALILRCVVSGLKRFADLPIGVRVADTVDLCIERQHPAGFLAVITVPYVP